MERSLTDRIVGALVMVPLVGAVIVLAVAVPPIGFLIALKVWSEWDDARDDARPDPTGIHTIAKCDRIRRAAREF